MLIRSVRMLTTSSFFWDAAGPVFPHQTQGLLGYGVPTSQLVYGSVGEVPGDVSNERRLTEDCRTIRMRPLFPSPSGLERLRTQRSSLPMRRLGCSRAIAELSLDRGCLRRPDSASMQTHARRCMSGERRQKELAFRVLASRSSVKVVLCVCEIYSSSLESTVNFCLTSICVKELQAQTFAKLAERSFCLCCRDKVSHLKLGICIHPQNMNNFEWYRPHVSSPLAWHVICATDVDYDPYDVSKLSPRTRLTIRLRSTKAHASPPPTHQHSDRQWLRPRDEHDADGGGIAIASRHFDREESPPPEEVRLSPERTPAPAPTSFGRQLPHFERLPSSRPHAEYVLDPQLAAPEFRSWPRPTVEAEAHPGSKDDYQDHLPEHRRNAIDSNHTAFRDFEEEYARPQPSSHDEYIQSPATRDQASTGPAPAPPVTTLPAEPQKAAADPDADGLKFVRRRRSYSEAAKVGQGYQQDIVGERPYKRQKVADEERDEEVRARLSGQTTVHSGPAEPVDELREP